VTLGEVRGFFKQCRISHFWIIVPSMPKGSNRNIPMSWRLINTVGSALPGLFPLNALRMMGPKGPGLVKRFRSDLTAKWAHLHSDTDTVPNYIYHLSAGGASGESAFKVMQVPIGWWK